MDLEAYREEMILIGRIRVKRNRWRVEAMILGDRDTLVITGKGLEWNKNEFCCAKIY